MNTIYPVTEKQWQGTVIEMARTAGFEFIYFTWNSRHSPAGFPDLVIIKEGRQIVAELKVGKGNLTPEQYFWLLEFMKVDSAEVYVWWPSDWDEVKSILGNFFNRPGNVRPVEEVNHGVV